MSLLKIKNLSVQFARSGQPAFDAVRNVSFQISQGETLALVGESGSGKSVTAHSILGLLPYPSAMHPSGSILFEGNELLNRTEKFLKKFRGNEIGMIFQEPMTALNPLHSIEKQISEVLYVHRNLSRQAATNRVIELLDLVGFKEGTSRLSALPHQLSGGQRQRVMIAMALACEPKLLIADEPTTALDVTIQAGIIKLLKQLQQQFKMGLLLISHDLNMVSQIADRIAVMRHGQIVEIGSADEILKKPTHPYTQALVAAEPSGDPAPLAANAPQILTACDIKVTFTSKASFFTRTASSVQAVNGISFSLSEGETLGIVGESGSGKSTLAYALLRLVESTGTIVFMGNELHHLAFKQMRGFRARMQIVFQDPFSSLNPRLSVGQIVAEGLTVHQKNLTSAEIEAAVIRSLQEVGLPEEIRFRYPHEFSGGQRQRISIARALILKPKLLVLDEPTSALDRSIQAEVIELLRNLQKRHKLSYLFISHDLKVVRAMSHRILVMRQGQLVELGTADQIINNPQTDYAKALKRAAFEFV
ncbi:ABC transporter ATP-binding protein [Candidatus Paracaedibacter symbiosus]|uniref:ABC transporter ATP-binding protein n=1 Tax=Candidatus Paracaedibacter symbiosus TaxID=244582 RepID=UPI00050959DB|nr:ABC transporter ATP-binding protein [Candidatus Paracaedibacter symbiosus]